MRVRPIDLKAPTKFSISREFAVALWMMVMLALLSCTTPSRNTITSDELRAKRKAFIHRLNTEYRVGLETALQRMEIVSSRASNPQEATFDILMIHGGGPAGGFAAGVLAGWDQISDPYFARPEFDHVTGSSSGSLVAPFAFIGSPEAYDRALHRALNPPTDWGSVSALSLWSSSKSILSNAGLKKFIQSEFDTETINQIARRADQSKILLIVTTHMDLGLGQAWNLALEAKKVSTTADPQRLHKILLASTALPIVLPPIEIDGELHSDGGIATTLFLGFDSNGFKWLADNWRKRYPGKPLPKIRVWAIVNQKLVETGLTTQPRYLSVGMRSLDIMMKYDRYKALRSLAFMIASVDKLKDIRAEFRYLAIPEDATIPSDLTELKNKKMVSELVELGRRLGADSSSWQTGPPDPYAIPEAGAPPSPIR